MRRRIAILLLCLCLSGCKSQQSYLSDAIDFRAKLVQAGGCSFEAEVTADFEDEILTFRLACDANSDGNVNFTILAPETLSGITASVTEGGGKITYDGLSIDFGLLAQDTLAPAAAPCLVVNGWISGYLSSAGWSEEIYQASYELDFEGNLLKVESFFKNELPISAEICYNSQRILELKIYDFKFH